MSSFYNIIDMEALYPDIRVIIENIEELDTEDQNKDYFKVILGEQSLVSETISLTTAKLNPIQAFDLKFTDSKFKVFLYKKKLLSADYLIGTGEAEIFPDHLSTYKIKLYDSVSNFVGNVNVSVYVTNIQSGMESLFGVPQDSNSGFNFIVLSRNFKNFVSCIEPIVSVHKAIENIYNWKSPSWSLLACFGLYILFKTNGFWIVVPGLWLWMIYSPTCSRKAESSIDTYKQNLYYIQEFMGAASIRLQKYKQWKQDVLYWGNPSSAKKFKRKLELIVIPIVIFSYIFTIGDVIMAVLILSIILKNPLIQLSILLIFFQSKNKITTVLATNTEKKYYRIYENQRLWFGVWKSFTLPAERGNWSDINGRNIEKDSIVLEEGWEWERDWEIDSENNSEGWEYSTDFTKSFHPKKEFWDYVRRRCWKRACVCI